jgi:hypothetical protein
MVGQVAWRLGVSQQEYRGARGRHQVVGLLGRRRRVWARLLIVAVAAATGCLRLSLL